MTEIRQHCGRQPYSREIMIHEHEAHGHERGHEHGHEPEIPFSDSEWEALRTEDKQGAAAVVGLMVGIFTIGLLLYLIVAMSASS
jgi:hypothetical protein